MIPSGLGKPGKRLALVGRQSSYYMYYKVHSSAATEMLKSTRALRRRHGNAKKGHRNAPPISSMRNVYQV
jgi:hypothetical protein